MYLIEKGYFGNPESLRFGKLMVVAHRDFKSFQKSSGMACLQTKFVPVPNYVARLNIFKIQDLVLRLLGKSSLEPRAFKVGLLPPTRR